MDEKLETMTFEIDQEIYDQVAPLFESIGTTIEDMAVGFIKFCVIPENLPLLKDYLGIEKTPAEAGAKNELHQKVFEQVYKIVTEKK